MPTLWEHMQEANTCRDSHIYKLNAEIRRLKDDIRLFGVEEPDK